MIFAKVNPRARTDSRTLVPTEVPNGYHQSFGQGLITPRLKGFGASEGGNVDSAITHIPLWRSRVFCK